MPNKMATASIVMSPDAGDPTPGITRRSTADALQRLQQLSSQPSVHSKWYEPGKDFGYVMLHCLHLCTFTNALASIHLLKMHAGFAKRASRS